MTLIGSADVPVNLPDCINSITIDTSILIQFQFHF